MGTRTHNAVYNLYTAMREDSPHNFEEIEEELAQDAVYNAPSCIIYRAVHPQWCTMLIVITASAAADNGQYMTVVNDLPGISISNFGVSVVLK